MPVIRAHFALRHCLAALLLLLSTAAGAAEDKGLFWHAQKGEHEIYLLGSVHMATKDFYPMRQQILQAYRDSDALVVEADILAAEKDPALQQKIMQESLYQGKRSLRDDLSPEVYGKLQKWLQQRQLPEPLFVRQRPAFAMITLSMVEMKARGLDPSLGIDRHFLKLAKSDGKPVVELEGVMKQLQVLNGLGEPDLLLEQTLAQLDDIGTFIPKLTSAWKTGDSDALYHLIIADDLAEHPEYRPVYETLFFNRNQHMAAGIRKASAAHPSVFVIVGAGHLVGEDSVIQRLKSKGYKVQQI
ncbi:TraB/GumN family protein [Microbulbifer sp. SAOS-129_SWC]|uniref:TraB/GumN family protein n=1 Tax=Microbulbifer sp. SAOS-129_SWC TaxID=3145235 RepID=UPI003216A09A